jgi:hypothetical protein
MSSEFKIDVYEVDVILNKKNKSLAWKLEMETLRHNNFVGIIEDVEKYFKKNKTDEPEILGARFFTEDGICNIKQKVIETIKARRNYG